MKSALLPIVLLLTACAATGTPPAPPPSKDGPGPASAAELPAPKALADGDRWFVAIRVGSGKEPVAERSRRSRGDGFLREEVTWDRSFADLAKAEHGTAQVFALLLGEKGLSVSLIDGTGRPAGDARLEVAAPYRAGTAWTVQVPGGSFEARVVGIEKADTPGGPVDALRVEFRAMGPVSMRMTTWYDAGLRPVRAEIRSGASEIIESRAALSSVSPTPEECKAAMAWARKNLSAPPQ